MKTKIELECIQCKKKQYVPILLSDHGPNWECKYCNEQNIGVFGPTFTTGIKLIFRSQYELNETIDYNLAIVFSAMAVDCELSRLFIKWTRIDDLGDHILKEREVYEKMLNQFRGNKEKLKGVIKLLGSDGVDFVFSQNKDFPKLLKKLIPGLTIQSFYNDVNEQLFWKRNRILHIGDVQHEKVDAIKCLNIASAILDLLKELDQKRGIQLTNKIQKSSE